MCFNNEYRTVEEVAPPKTAEELLKLTQPRSYHYEQVASDISKARGYAQYRFHHIVHCRTNPTTVGCATCLGCKYFSSCNFGKIEWDETI